MASIDRAAGRVHGQIVVGKWTAIVRNEVRSSRLELTDFSLQQHQALHDRANHQASPNNLNGNRVKELANQLRVLQAERSLANEALVKLSRENQALNVSPIIHPITNVMQAQLVAHEAQPTQPSAPPPAVAPMAQPAMGSTPYILVLIDG